MNDQTLALEIDQLKFGYQPSQQDIEISNFQIAQGETIFLYGPSGAGKTTLLNLCAGVLVPYQGTLKVTGTELKSLSASKRDLFRGKEIGVIFQQFNLIEYLSVMDNILLPARLHPKKNFKETYEKAISLLEKLNLVDHKDKIVTKLSIGQRQRVAAARSFLMDPKFLIADEPTSSLDQENTAAFITALLDLAREHKTSVLFVSHDERLSEHFDREVSLLEINKIRKENT
jgi:putative ABC transport system ATP-binding protein